jgi:hypothetical protein
VHCRAKVLSNRSKAKLRLGDDDGALADANECIRMAPALARGCVTVAVVYFFKPRLLFALLYFDSLAF